MNIKQYKTQVINLFKNGKATKKQYEEMASAVLDASENDFSDTNEIDNYIEQFFPEFAKERANQNYEDYPAHDC